MKKESVHSIACRFERLPALSLLLALAISRCALGDTAALDDANFSGDLAPSQVIPLMNGARKAYVFTDTSATGTLVARRTLTLEKLLVVGGGGGAGGHIGAGGGGGGVIYSEGVRLISAGEQIVLAVGAGGNCVSGSNAGLQGGTSSIKIGDDAIIEAFGGGGGGAENKYPTSVSDGRIASAGGGMRGFSSFVDGTHYNSAQGTRGGTSSGRWTGGGGGALTRGLGYSDNSQDGGEGVTNSITGVAEVYGSGGGGGAGWDSHGYKTCGKGGTHAGDGAAYGTSTGGTPGDDGFGGGGGGSARSSGRGVGGSGTVILYLAETDTSQLKFTALPVADAVYYDTPVRLEPVVSNVVTGVILEKGVDYALAWTNDTVTGSDRTSTCTVTATGMGVYAGIEASTTYTLTRAYQFTISSIPRQPYMGQPITPEVEVVNAILGVTLLAWADYTVSYADNEAIGWASVTVTGMEGTRYEGLSASVQFEIVEAYTDEYICAPDTSVRRIDDGQRVVYVFTNTADMVRVNFLKDMTLVETLVVGGGGQGGGLLAGGGGGGGVLTSADVRPVYAGNTIDVTVGAGGRSTTTTDAQGEKGGESSVEFGNFSLVAYGGGGGGTCNKTTKDGVSITAGMPTRDGRIGSGGGSTKGFNCQDDGLYYTSSQGNSGGKGTGYLGGGGGGAGEAGRPSANSASGRGGEGVTNSITGVAEVYGSGGGGGGGKGGTGGAEAQGGTHGGTGAVQNASGVGSNGDDGFGAGGGGGGYYSSPKRGGAGGCGTVILAFTKGGGRGQPELDEGDVDFRSLGAYTIPRVDFALGGEEGTVYSATVTVSLGVDGETDPRMTQVFTEKLLGDVISVTGDFSPAPGTVVWCRIVVEADGAETIDLLLSRTMAGKIAPFIGHGGGEGVVHVWADAPGDGSGSDWLNAATNLNLTLSQLDSSAPEVWILGDISLPARAAITLTSAVAVRGGFTGVEDSPSERRQGARSVLDGGNAVDLLMVSNNPMLTLDSIEFTRALNRAVVSTGSSLYVTNCSFESNGTTVERKEARAMHATGASGLTARFVDTRFAGNTEKGTYASEGTCVLLSTFARATFDGCTFATNGIIPGVVSGTSGYGEGGTCKGAALKTLNTPLTMRGCTIVANRAACRGSTSNGGAVRLFGQSYPSAFSNCLFVGNSNRQPHRGASEKIETCGGALVLDLSSAAGAVDVYACTFAWNVADCRSSPGALNVITGSLKVRNCVFWANARRDIGTSGADIDVKSTGAADVDYSLFAGSSTDYLTSAEEGGLVLGEHNVWGNPRFVTGDEDLAGIIKTNASTYNFIYLDWNRLDELTRFNAHLRGGRGYHDEATGALVTAYVRGGHSPAMDAGDPESPYGLEPDVQAGWHGKRVNLGIYGNTPYATMSTYPGMILRVR